MASAAGLGLAFGIGAAFTERTLERALALPSFGNATSGFLAAAYTFCLIAPLEQALTALASLPGLRSRRIKTPLDAWLTVVAAAVGMSTVRAAALYLANPDGAIAVVRSTLIVASHVVFVALWGYTVARARRRSLGGSGFASSFFAAVIFRGLIDYLVIGRGLAAAASGIPLIVSAAILAILAYRELGQTRNPRARRSVLRDPPSIDTIRQALRKRQGPLVTRWIVLGSVVTLGIMVTFFAIAILLGRRLGVDFALVDQARFDDRAAAPFILIGTSLLAAFPCSGFLLARASGANSVLEPALSATLAIVAVLVLLGTAAPIAAAFALACAPVAFTLSCMGAWVGCER